MRNKISLVIKVILFPIYAYFIYLVVVTPGFYLVGKPQQNTESQLKSGNNKAVIYYINLENSKTKQQEISKLVNKLNFPSARIEAVNGNKLSDSLIYDLIDQETFKYHAYRAQGKGIRAGEVGAYLSHIKVWKEFLQSDYSYAIVFEDDAKFDPKTLNIVIPDILKQNSHWDIAKLFTDYTEDNFSFKIPAIKLNSIYNLNFILENHAGTVGYIINRKAATTMLNYSAKLPMPVDIFMERTWETGLKLMIVQPNLVQLNPKYNNKFLSEIGTSKIYKIAEISKSPFIAKTQKMLSHSKSEFMNFFYNLYLYVNYIFS